MKQKNDRNKFMEFTSEPLTTINTLKKISKINLNMATEKVTRRNLGGTLFDFHSYSWLWLNYTLMIT